MHGANGQGTTENQHASPNNISFLGKKNDQFDMKNLSANNEMIADVGEQLCSGKNEMQENVDVNTCLKNSEDSDLFKQHFGSLSAANRVSIVSSYGIYNFLGLFQSSNCDFCKMQFYTFLYTKRNKFTVDPKYV